MNSDHLRNETPAARDVKTIHSLEQQLALEHERYLRLAADFDNYKKRMAREMDRRAASQKEALLRDLLPAVDNLERIVAAKVSSGESLYPGAKMIFDRVIESLNKHGFEPREDRGRGSMENTITRYLRARNQTNLTTRSLNFGNEVGCYFVQPKSS
jgi:molecular chaperone GrpE